MIASRPIRSSFFLLAIAGFYGCQSQEAATTESAASIGTIVSSESLFQALSTMTSTDKARAASAIGGQSFSNLYDHFSRELIDHTLTIDGAPITGFGERLRAEASDIKALDAIYPTVADYWRAGGVDINATVSSAQLRIDLANAVSTLRQGSSGLSLGGMEWVPTLKCRVAHGAIIIGATAAAAGTYLAYISPYPLVGAGFMLGGAGVAAGGGIAKDNGCVQPGD